MEKRQSYFTSSFKTREEENKKYIEGYFAVFDQETELWPHVYEKIAPNAFTNSLSNNDIRCLFNHDTAFVLGRSKNSTLKLKQDEHGLHGIVEINPEDRQAMDVYARVSRGDITGCSFGFNPTKEKCDTKEDGDHWTVFEADTAEVSICTFPAYPQTEIMARKKEFENQKRQSFERKKLGLKKRMEEIKNA